MNDSEITSFFRGVTVLIPNAFDRPRVLERIPEIVARREPRGSPLSVRDWRIRRMNTPCGTCTSKARRICLNSELVTKPPPCLESAVVEETPHLIERRHNERFRTILDCIAPDWWLRLDQLNRAYFAAEDWGEIPSSPGRVPR